MRGKTCRACRRRAGRVVLDLGEQPACDYFPPCDDPGPDPVYPLQMWMCSACGLAQLAADPTVPEEPRGAEPSALVAQAKDAVDRAAAAGLLPPGARVAEFGSPHGGSWLGLLARRGLRPVRGSEAAQDKTAEVVLDCFGLMHCADQSAGLALRAGRVARGGVLLLQYHSLAAIVRRGQWNALRHGHYAYYSTAALTAMLRGCGFSPRMAWQFDLYGGTVLLAARRDADGGPGPADPVVRSLLADEARVLDAASIGRLQESASAHAARLRAWLVAQRSAGRSVLGYGAASRAVALLCRTGADRSLLPAVVDASPGKQGRRMPGTDIPIVSPAALLARRPDVVLLFLSDLLAEVRKTFPGIEESGGEWVEADRLGLNR